jgi:hypothetical protein
MAKLWFALFVGLALGPGLSGQTPSPDSGKAERSIKELLGEFPLLYARSVHELLRAMSPADRREMEGIEAFSGLFPVSGVKLARDETGQPRATFVLGQATEAPDDQVALDLRYGTEGWVLREMRRPREGSWLPVDEVERLFLAREVELAQGRSPGLLMSGVDPAIPLPGTALVPRPQELARRAAIELFQSAEDGSWLPLRMPVKPSFPSPVITVGHFALEDVAVDSEGSMTATVVARGTVRSVLCDHVPGDEGRLRKIALVVNGDEPPSLWADVTGAKGEAGPADRPFPFDGAFNLRIPEVGVTEGLNTFALVARDPRSTLSGATMWTATFTADYPEDGDGEPDFTRAPRLSVTETREVFASPPGEVHFYTPMLVNPAEDLPGGTSAAELHLGTDPCLRFRLEPQEGSDRWIARHPDTGHPARLFFMPPSVEGAITPDDGALVEGMEQGFAMGNTHTQFVYAYCLGFFLGGFQVHEAGGGSPVHAVRMEGGASPLPEVPGRIQTASGLQASVALGVSPPKFVLPTGPAEGGALADLLARLHVKGTEGDDAAGDVAIALITGGFDELVPDHAPLTSWTEDFISAVSSVSSYFLERGEEESPVSVAYHLGRAHGAAMGVALDARHGVTHELSRGVLLLGLPARSSFYRNGAPGSLALEDNADLIEELTGEKVQTRGF